jgi:hypothetical protein
MPAPKKIKKPGKKGGRPPDPLLSKLATAYLHKKTHKPYWKCAAKGCNVTLAGNLSSNRVFGHARDCRFISPDLLREVNDRLINGQRKGRKVPIATENSSDALLANASSTGNSKQIDIPKASQEWFASTVEVGCQELQKKINTDLMLLVCRGNLVPALLDQPVWKKFMADMNPHVRPTSSTKIKQKIIPEEAAMVRNEQFLELQQAQNLTLTFDGGGTQGKQSIYFVHVTTPDRVVYFVRGDEGTTLKHTATYIKDVLEPVSLHIFVRHCVAY